MSDTKCAGSAVSSPDIRCGDKESGRIKYDKGIIIYRFVLLGNGAIGGDEGVLTLLCSRGNKGYLLDINFGKDLDRFEIVKVDGVNLLAKAIGLECYALGYKTLVAELFWIVNIDIKGYIDPLVRLGLKAENDTVIVKDIIRSYAGILYVDLNNARGRVVNAEGNGNATTDVVIRKLSVFNKRGTVDYSVIRKVVVEGIKRIGRGYLCLTDLDNTVAVKGGKLVFNSTRNKKGAGATALSVIGEYGSVTDRLFILYKKGYLCTRGKRCEIFGNVDIVIARAVYGNGTEKLANGCAVRSCGVKVGHKINTKLIDRVIGNLCTDEVFINLERGDIGCRGNGEGNVATLCAGNVGKLLCAFISGGYGVGLYRLCTLSVFRKDTDGNGHSIFGVAVKIIGVESPFGFAERRLPATRNGYAVSRREGDL